MQLTLTTFLSIDGVMQGPGGPEEDRRDGFDLGGWLVPFADDDMNAYVGEWFAHADAFLLGTRTFEIFEAYWPTVTQPADPVAQKLNTHPKHVVSSTRTSSDWAGTSFVTGDLRTEIEALKARPGDELQIHGSGRLARSLHDLGLIDEYRLWIFPVVLGTGQRLFSDGTIPTSFELVDRRSTAAGVNVLCFRPTGAVVRGTFAVEDGAEVTR